MPRARPANRPFDPTDRSPADPQDVVDCLVCRATGKTKEGTECPACGGLGKTVHFWEGETVQVSVTNVREWFDGWQLHKEGDSYFGTFKVDDAGNAVLPEHVVLTDDYEPVGIDLPATNLDARNRTRPRRNASGLPRL